MNLFKLSKNFKLLLFPLLFFSLFSKAQNKITISGTITDNATKEALIGVNVYVAELKTGISTNEYGFYSLTIPKGNYTLKLAFVGYNSVLDSVNLFQNTKKDFLLIANSKALTEVVVNGNKKKAEIKSPEMSVNKLSVQAIKEMPVVMGEVDVIKSILHLPGVTNAGEGQSGFNVRGGGADQNLILLDEATIYNSSHLFGFFSVFNSDAINDIKLYKGGIPARYGGRLSSVLDIYQKEGNKSEIKYTGGIGIVSSRLLAEGPLVKNKGSFLFAGRSTYGHLFLKMTDIKSSAYFYDLNTKLSYQINPKNKVFLSGYFGRDLFKFNSDFINTYGNAVINMRWNHLFSDKLFSNLSAIYSDYYYGLEIGFAGFNWQSGIKNFNVKYDFKHYLSNSLKLTYGLNAQNYILNPGTITPTNEKSQMNPDQLDKKYAFEPSIYFDVEQNVSKNITVNYGLRYSSFYRLGNQNINIYANNQTVNYNSELNIYEKALPIGTQKFDKNEIIANFGNLEPRLSVAYAFTDNKSVKASYNRMAQYLHLISNTQSPTPLDIWAPSDNFLKPQILDQVALGYFQNFNNDKYSLETETFYKKIKNRVDFIDGTELIANKALEQVVLNGIGRAYGLELMIRKNTGKLTGWLSYTLSKSEQQTPGRTANEIGINNGLWYNAASNKLYNVAITSTYKLNPKWRLGAIFALQSGIPTSFPNGKYQYQGINVPTYGLRNKNNLPQYHHLDVSATYLPKPLKEKGWQSEWVFSIYNLYNRQNAASIAFTQNTQTGVNEAKRLSIFGAVPSVTYNFKF